MLLVFYALIAGGNSIIAYLGGFRLMADLLFCLAVVGVCAVYWAIVVRKGISSRRGKLSRVKRYAVGFGVLSLLLAVVAAFGSFDESLNSIVSRLTDGRYPVLSMQLILGYVFAPVIWLTGVAVQDVPLVGQLLGQKIILTEFVGYNELSNMLATNAFAETKSAIIATYILCGFANFASVGIEIGGIGSIAPNQRATLSIFGMRALLGGALAALISAAIVGVINN
jgi:CNT family concentrative nucleoside transporter